MALSVPEQDLAEWYEGNGSISSVKKWLAALIGEQHKLSVKEMALVRPDCLLTTGESTSTHSCLVFIHDFQAMVVASPVALKVRMLEASSARTSWDSTEPPPEWSHLLPDFSLLFEWKEELQL